MRMKHIILVLRRGAQQETALDQLLVDQQDPGSVQYRHWLTPDEFGERFGVQPADVQRVTDWLESAGFQVENIPAGRATVVFSGTVQQVEQAFHTEIHRYLEAGKPHIANATELAIPEALSDVVRGVASLHDFYSRPQTNMAGGGHALSPYDYATIYDILPLWNGGTDGSGQSIAIVGRAAVAPSDFSGFRIVLGLDAGNLHVTLDNYDPSAVMAGDLTEANLDTQWASAVAKQATIILVASTGTPASDGVSLAAQYAVNHNVAPVLSVSFGLCEAELGPSGNAFYESLWKQAAVQGMTVVVAAGDTGSAGCELAGAAQASSGLAVNGIASTPYTLAVGGTQFNDGDGGVYWNTNNDPHQASALGYIPETAWNESSATGLWAGSGGISTLYAASPWQRERFQRTIPDVSLTAATHDGYLVMQNGGWMEVSGTSATAPAFAGMMALVNQRVGSRVGVANWTLYAMSEQVPSAFHDITTGTNAVPCVVGSPDCTAGRLNGYNADAGYDLATGLGSVDAGLMVANWADISSRVMVGGKKHAY